jgi:hypothetical protein
MNVTPEIIELLELLLETPEELLEDDDLDDSKCMCVDWNQESLATKGQQKRILEIIREYTEGQAEFSRAYALDWPAMDWSMRNVDIMKLHNIPKKLHHLVSFKRQILAPETVKKSGKGLDWESVDWSQTNRAIADQLGCAIRIVSKKRPKTN